MDIRHYAEQYGLRLALVPPPAAAMPPLQFDRSLRSTARGGVEKQAGPRDAGPAADAPHRQLASACRSVVRRQRRTCDVLASCASAPPPGPLITDDARARAGGLCFGGPKAPGTATRHAATTASRRPPAAPHAPTDAHGDGGCRHDDADGVSVD